MRRDSGEPLYVISIAARLVNCHPQTLRTYERMGLIAPRRSDNNVRLYSDADIELLAGVEIVLNLLNRIEALQEELERLRRDLELGPRRLNPPAQPTAEVRVVDSSEEDVV